MRINKKVYPNLEDLVYRQFKGGVQPFYVSKPFYKAAAEEQDKFSEGETVGDALNDYISLELHGEKFLFLLNDGLILEGQYGNYVAFWDNGRVAMVSEWAISDNNLLSIKGKANPKAKFQDGFNFIALVSVCKFLLAFKKYSDIKYKELNPRGKVKDFNCKYKSDFDFKIGLLTESWFTDSKGSPFAVRAHLHKYRWGPGKKWIKFNWIDLYMKGGVHRQPLKNNSN